MTRKEKNNSLIALLIGAIIFTVIAKKKKPTGAYVPEDGEFGEFGTDGNFEEDFKEEPKVFTKPFDFRGTGFNPLVSKNLKTDFKNFSNSKTNLNATGCDVC